jgi:hypothetical protein
MNGGFDPRNLVGEGKKKRKIVGRRKRRHMNGSRDHF